MVYGTQYNVNYKGVYKKDSSFKGFANIIGDHGGNKINISY